MAQFSVKIMRLTGSVLGENQQLRANPLGIYVNAINWSREMSQ